MRPVICDRYISFRDGFKAGLWYNVPYVTPSLELIKLRYTFEWDPNKASRNLQKHKVSFERATEIFLDPLAISIFDEEHSDDEERWITMGKDSHEVVLVVVHTFREVAADEWIIRVISTWKATKNEARQYEDYEI